MNVGFIGAGNMGSALMAGMAGHAKLRVFDIAPEAVRRAEAEYQAEGADSIAALVEKSQIIFVAVKPQFLQDILEPLQKAWTEEKMVASIVAGKTIGDWQDILGPEAQIVRIMPNTPAMVKEAMNTLCFSKSVRQPQRVMELLSYTGKVMELPENLMDAAMGIAGCGPAFVYLFIEALADAGVAGGLFRRQAYELAAQTVLGAAKMVLETKEHPAALKDAVCSPGGITIQGVMALEEYRFRAGVEKAVQATIAAVQSK